MIHKSDAPYNPHGTSLSLASKGLTFLSVENVIKVFLVRNITRC
jgi:hypothetical protein